MRSNSAHRQNRGSPHPGAQRPGTVHRPRQTQMGESDGSKETQDLGSLSNVSHGHPIWTSCETTKHQADEREAREYRVTRRCWKAGCVERRTSSLGEGSRKRTDKAPRRLPILHLHDVAYT